MTTDDLSKTDLFTLKYPLGIHKAAKALKNRTDKSFAVLDLIAPFASGRDYRAKAPTKALSNKFEKHIALLVNQMRCYLEQKKQLSLGQLGEDTMIIIQDFTQITISAGFCQTLIIVLYYYRAGDLQHDYIEYVGEKGVKRYNFFSWCLASLC